VAEFRKLLAEETDLEGAKSDTLARIILDAF
jgi:hypothetical protein